MSVTGAGAEAVEEARRILGPLATVDGPLGARTTYRVGGPAALVVEVRTRRDLGLVAAAHLASGLSVLPVGKGSNLLVADQGFPGIAVILDPASEDFGFVQILASGVSAGAAVALPTLARRCVEAGLRGFEWAVGVPGSVGGAVRMNAGGHGSEMSECLASVEVADLSVPPGPGGEPTVTSWSPSRLAHRYRGSALGPADLVISAQLTLRTGDVSDGQQIIREIVKWRRDHQPGGNNAGSVFVNPGEAAGGWSAGKLIEASGLKGERYGTAEVSPKHANFIQADANGSADDVDALMGKVRGAVVERFGVELTTEIRRVGFPDSRPQQEG